MTENKVIRVLLADDHPVVRKGIREFLEEEDIMVVAEASDGLQAMELIATHRPDIAIVDVQMPNLTGIEVTRRVKALHPDVRVLVLTAYDDEPYINALLQGGADGYVLKTSDSAELVRAIRAIYQGKSVLDPAVTQKVIQQLAQDNRHPTMALQESLTDREREIVALVAKGLTNKEIARMLSISDRTVQGHLANTYGKLGVNSRTEAATCAIRLGLIVID